MGWIDGGHASCARPAIVIGHRHAMFGLFLLALVAAQPATLARLADLSVHDSTASHHLLIPVVAVVLIAQRRESVFQSVHTAVVSGLAVVLAGVAILWIGHAYRTPLGDRDALSVSVAALVVMCVGGFLLIYGRQASRAALFALLFLGFTIPIPDVVLQSVTQLLKAGSADTVAGLFTIAGVPYHREGFVFSLPSFVIEIADECSGIRSSIALLLTSLLAGHMFLRRAWSRALLAVAVVPVAIFKNAVRIASLSLLATHVDPSFLTGQLHHEGGVVFFLLALLILSPLFILLQRSEVRQTDGASPA